VSVWLSLFFLAGQADVGDVRATYRTVPSTVEVGEPFALVLELDHPADESVFALASGELVLDDSWVVLDDARFAPEGVGDGTRRLTRRTWTLVSLEPGTRTLADTLPILTGVRTVDASLAAVEVASVLAADEDAPRPPRGFPEGFGRGVSTAPPSPLRWVALGVALALWTLALVVWWRRRRGGPQEHVVVLPAAERLAALRAGTGFDESGRIFALTELVREAVDRCLVQDASGCTDSEWLACVRTRLPSVVAADVADLLDRTEALKYGGQVPTQWALDEVFRTAQRTLDQLEIPEVAA